MTDAQLLTNFATHKDQHAFAELVRRHIDWVYSLARRLVSDSQAAEDVTQAVFILVAQKAPLLATHRQFNGWLFRATRYCAANALKQQAARRRHEQEAAAMRAEQSPPERDANPLWQEIAPHLDAALARLNAPDREALLLKYYQNKTAAEVGATLGVSEEAAKKRLQRALDRLRTTLTTTTASATSTSVLATTLTAHVTRPAPAALAPALAATKTTAAATLAKAAANTMWWAQAKIAAAILITAAVAGTASYQIVIHSLAVNAATSTVASPALPSIAPTPDPAAPIGFDPLYEKAPPSTPELAHIVGPNTFAIKAIVRFDSNNKPVAIDNLGHPLNPATLPLASTPSPASAWSFGERLLIQLDPPPTRYDIDRLRIFNHATRRYISGIIATPLPSASAIEIRAFPGTLPPQIDLWLATCSYNRADTPVSLAPSTTATASLPGTTITLGDIRDGAWNFDGTRFTTLVGDEGQRTSLEIRSTPPGNSGRYQIAAVSKDGRKNISDFFLQFLDGGTGRTLDFPFGLSQIDHFELRPNAHQPPFYFDGVPLPAVTSAAAPSDIPTPIIIPATGPQTDLPSGVTIELAAIAHYPADGQWWDINGDPTDAPRAKFNGSATADKDQIPCELFARASGPGHNFDILWNFTPSSNWASGSDGKTSRVAVGLPRDGHSTVRLGVAGPWHTLEELPLATLPAHAQKWPITITSIHQRGPDLLVNISMLPPRENVRYLLIDAAGKPHTVNGYSSRNEDKVAPWGASTSQLTFIDLPLADTRTLRLETSQFEFAEFKNIPINPR